MPKCNFLCFEEKTQWIIEIGQKLALKKWLSFTFHSDYWSHQSPTSTTNGSFTAILPLFTITQSWRGLSCSSVCWSSIECTTDCQTKKEQTERFSLAKETPVAEVWCHGNNDVCLTSLLINQLVNKDLYPVNFPHPFFFTLAVVPLCKSHTVDRSTGKAVCPPRKSSANKNILKGQLKMYIQMIKLAHTGFYLWPVNKKLIQRSEKASIIIFLIVQHNCAGYCFYL